MEVLEKILGPSHPEVASVIVEFSTVLRAMKKLNTAESLLLTALEIRESNFGPFHPETASCVQLLSALYKVNALGLSGFVDRCAS